MEYIINDKEKIAFLLKTTKSEYIKPMTKNGRFCFTQPFVFNKWENKDSAQYDKWDSHSAYEITHLVAAPILGTVDGQPKYGKIQKVRNKGIVREQDAFVKQSFICCFRYIPTSDVSETGVIHSFFNGNAERIMKEFKHDAFIILPASEFIERLLKKVNLFAYGPIVYKDFLNDYRFQVPEDKRVVIEQLFRKDCKYEWQREYRFVLPPQPNNTTTNYFVEIGSIEDIAFSGKIADYI